MSATVSDTNPQGREELLRELISDVTEKCLLSVDTPQSSPAACHIARIVLRSLPAGVLPDYVLPDSATGTPCILFPHAGEIVVTSTSVIIQHTIPGFFAIRRAVLSAFQTVEVVVQDDWDVIRVGRLYGG